MRKMFLIWLIIGIILGFLSGCAVIAYVRIGPQKVKKVTIILEEQEADPNIAEAMIKVGAIAL